MFNPPRRALAGITLLACLATLGLLAGGGPLNPPAGAVTGTAKPLSEVEPRTAVNAANTPGDNDATPSLFKITQPGSYYLTGNITGVLNRHGIEIGASGVTLDLNGFQVVSSLGALTGIIVTNTASERIVIRNGRVLNFIPGGIDANVPGVEIDRVSVEACGVIGIRVGDRSHVTDCSAIDCHTNATGITAGDNSIIARCIAVGNTGTGISTGSGSTVADCSASQNGGNGISVTSRCTVADCTTRINTLDGIRCTSACVVRGNACGGSGNGASGAGIHVTGIDNRIEGNNCTGANRGIDVDASGNIFIKNTCASNVTNWDVVANNVILVVSGVNAPAILGSSGGAGPNSTGINDPNANFSY